MGSDGLLYILSGLSAQIRTPVKPIHGKEELIV
jgi:hypothetical protein